MQIHKWIENFDLQKYFIRKLYGLVKWYFKLNLYNTVQKLTNKF